MCRIVLISCNTISFFTVWLPRGNRYGTTIFIYPVLTTSTILFISVGGPLSFNHAKKTLHIFVTLVRKLILHKINEIYKNIDKAILSRIKFYLEFCTLLQSVLKLNFCLIILLSQLIRQQRICPTM